MSDNTPKLHFVRVYLGKCRMDVAVDDPLGGFRLIEYVWKSKESTDVPPKDWWSAVVGEVKYQRGVELRRKKGVLVGFE